MAACISSGGSSATPADSIGLRAALDSAWPRAVAARESAGQSRRAEAELVAASSLWAAPPSLQLSHSNDRLHDAAGRRETEFGVSMPLWLPGQRSAREGTAQAAAALARAQEELARLRLAGELRERAWQLVAAQAEVAQACAFAQSLQQLAGDVERRVRAGDLARADALAAQAEFLAAWVQQSDANLRLQTARESWTLLSGQPRWPDLRETDAAPAPPAPAVQHAELQHAELQSAAQSTALARQRVEALRRSRRDSPELTLGLRQDVPGRAEATQTRVVVGLRLPFGTADRNRPLEAAALAELDVAETHEQRLGERLASDIATAGEAQRSAAAQLDAESARARLLRERATLVDKAFRAGEAPLPELLRALTGATQAESAVARQTAALGLAGARLRQALGLLP